MRIPFDAKMFWTMVVLTLFLGFLSWAYRKSLGNQSRG